MNTLTNVTRLPGVIPQWSFADRLRKARREFTSFTQEAMADHLGVTLKAYSAWEAGKNNGPRDIARVAVDLEQLTGVPKTWFLGWVDDEGPAPIANPRPMDYTYAGSNEVIDLRTRRAI